MLEEMNFGDKFVKALRGIYKEQKSHLIINNERTEVLKLWKRTRQECPLSPLLFVLVLEVILRKIQLNEKITGLKLNFRRSSYVTIAHVCRQIKRGKLPRMEQGSLGVCDGSSCEFPA